MKADIRQGLFGRWFLFDPTCRYRAWSGSRWVDCDQNGLGIGSVQTCNFETRDQADKYAAKMYQREFSGGTGGTTNGGFILP